MEILSRILYIFKSKDYDSEVIEEQETVQEEEKKIAKDFHFYLSLILLFLYGLFLQSYIIVLNL